MINLIFTKKYNEEAFTEYIQGIIPSLTFDKKLSEIRTGFKSIQQIAEATGKSLDLVVFVAKLDSSLNARIEITKNTYAVLKNHARSNALVAYISDDSTEWRLSLITTKVTRTKDGIKESISNPRRFSYVLGPNAKVATPSKMLQGTIDSIVDLGNKFSLAVVSKEFFNQIANQYSKLVGGTRGEGKKAITYERTLKIGITDDAVNANFAIRLIGRLVFCWFLKQKKGHLNNPLIPSEILSVSAVETITDYYHSVCVPLFFEVLNKPQSSRPTFFSYSELFDRVPFLNGGLFQDHAEDNHKFNRTTGMSERRGVVNVPDIWFSELFQIFEEYNFTIDENTSIDTELSIDPEMLGRIFENLLAEVNPETDASARKSTGSFYTPREIVDFMVGESLIAHLKTKTNISEEKLRSLSSYNLDDDASHPISQKERKQLVEAIHDTTVLDPACGSGAFPIGVLQRLVHMLGVLDPECSIYLSKIPPEMRRQLQKQSLPYVRKLGVIRECIHGVDIQPIAIDISRLRCFLTLIVDQQVNDNAPNRGIEPLPNLDFKFVCANTLIKPPVHEGPLFGDEFADALGELIDEYFAPVDQLHKLETARKLQQLISDKTKRELESILKSYNYLKDEKYKKALAQKNEKTDMERLRINDLWGSYENIFQNKPVGFFDTRYFFPVVFRSGGFDVVIGNPPYIKEYTNKSAFDGLRGSPYYQGKMDLWYMFSCNSFDLLKDNGIECFIAQNNWVTSSGASKMRNKIIKDVQILSLVDFGDYKIFENAGIQTMVMLFMKKSSQPEYSFDLRTIISKKPTHEDITAILDKTKNDSIQYLQPKIVRSVFLNKKLVFNNQKINKVLEKILNKSNFKFNDKEIANGIHHHHGEVNKDRKSILGGTFKVGDGIFVISEKEKNDIQFNESEISIIKPSYTTKELHKWCGEKQNKEWVIYTDSSFKDIKKIDNYPNIKKHLDKFKAVITSDNKPYGLHRSREENFFLGEKIIVARKCELPAFTYTDFDAYVSATFYIIKTDRINQKYLTAILNSKLIAFWLKNKGKMQGNNYQLDKEPILEIPIFAGNETEQNKLITIVDKILIITKSNYYLENPAKKEEVKEYEKQIDLLVYNLYDLTPEEIDVIENSNKK